MNKFLKNLLIIIIIPTAYFLLAGIIKKIEFGKNNFTGGEINSTEFVQQSSGNIVNEHDKFSDTINIIRNKSLDIISTEDKLNKEIADNKTLNDRSLGESAGKEKLKKENDKYVISSLCFSQCVDYVMPYENKDTRANSGFCFSNINGTITGDSGRRVLYSKKSSDHNPKIICSEIFENLQHSDYINGQEDSCMWIFHPVMRANLDGIDDTLPIFKIEFYDFRGKLMEDWTRIFYAMTFKQNGNYHNEYIKDFNYMVSSMRISAAGDEKRGINQGRDGLNLKKCRIDFKIYTYGYADIWFEKLIVNDLTNENLINKSYDLYIQKCLSGLDKNSTIKYLTEVPYSQLSSIKYIMDKINEFNIKNDANIKFELPGKNILGDNSMRVPDYEGKITFLYLHTEMKDIFEITLNCYNNLFFRNQVGIN